MLYLSSKADARVCLADSSSLLLLVCIVQQVFYQGRTAGGRATSSSLQIKIPHWSVLWKQLKKKNHWRVICMLYSCNKIWTVWWPRVQPGYLFDSLFGRSRNNLLHIPRIHYEVLASNSTARLAVWDLYFLLVLLEDNESYWPWLDWHWDIPRSTEHWWKSLRLSLSCFAARIRYSVPV